MQLSTGPIKTDYKLLFRSLPGFFLVISPQHTILALSNRLRQTIGLGLYMIIRIMQNNNGFVEVESTTGEESTFRIFFRKN